MDFNIEPFSNRHVKPAAQLEKHVFSDEPWSESAFESELSLPTAVDFAAVINDGLEGYIITSCVMDQACINNFAVSFECRNKGIGTALLNTALSELKHRGARSVALEVRQSNESAKKLYIKAGFETVGVRKNFYKFPAEDACLMVLNF